MKNNEEIVSEILKEYYTILTEGLIGTVPFEIAKIIRTNDFVKAKNCSLNSVEKILQLPIHKVSVQKKWSNIMEELKKI